MNKYVKLICLIFVPLLTASLFGACGKKQDASSGGSGDAGSVDTGGIISTADVNFVDSDGESTYRVVRPEDDANILPLATSVYKKVLEVYKVKASNISDSTEKDGRAEILIGDTNRESTKKARELLIAEVGGHYNDYIICTIDNDIVIYAPDNETLSKAVERFNTDYITGNVVTGGINCTFSDTSGFTELKIFGIDKLAKINIVKPIYNTSYLTMNAVDELVDDIKKKSGYAPKIVNDTVTAGPVDPTLSRTETAEYEIIVGNCDRDGVKTISDHDTYEIRIEDRKIFLNGGSPYATAMAVTEFDKLISANLEITSSMSVENGNYNDAIGSYDTATTYVPTWRDDFDGTEIDLKKWDVRWDEVSGYRSAANGKDQRRGNKQLNNNYVADGKLYEVAVETSDTYYGGMLTTIDLMEYLYGYIEISTVHPKGMGFWTALWTQSKGAKNVEDRTSQLFFSETDVEECYGPGTWAYGNTFAWPTSLGKENGYTETIHVNNKVISKDARGFWMDFHTYGYEWLDNTHVRFTCDGEVYADQQLREGPEQIAYSQPAYLKLSLACGSGNHGQPTTDPDEWADTNKYIVDWVHIYQKDGQSLWSTDMLHGDFKKIH